MPDGDWKSRIEKALTNLLLILFVAFAARLAFGVNQISRIPASALTAASFDQETGSIASSLATGKGFSNPFNRETGPTAWLTPVYPLLVAASFKLFGLGSLHSFYFLVFLNIVFSAGVCIPIFSVGKRLAGLAAGSLAAWLWALFPSAILVPFEWVWDTSLAALLAALLLWATLKVAESARWRDWCGYGLLWGFALMTNPAIGALLPFLLGWAAYHARQRKALFLPAGLRKPALALLLAVLCCVPWTIRNYSVFHRFIPLRSNFPFELYIGNNENYASDHPRYPPPITKERETVRYIHMGEIPFVDEEMRKAKLFIEEHPRRVLTLFGDRFAAFWTGAPFAVQNFLATDSRLVRTVLLCSTLSGLGALAGMVVLFWRRSPFAFPLAIYPLVFPLVYYITHTSLRYRHPVDPIVLLLTAIACVAAFRSLFRRQIREAEPNSVATLT
jgi:4-amino-4-deoxy-L-arabinose transferase-like glycosyltransferase